ncbi:PspA/IM30 family protein, partial [Nitrospirillum viridazoti]
MGLFSRLGDIIDANLNAMLDRAEDPERLIGLVIQEMEDTLVEVRAEAVRSMARRKELEARYRDVEFELLEWDRKAELAVTKGREDLARGALVAKARLADAADPIRREIQAISDSLAKGADDV